MCINSSDKEKTKNDSSRKWEYFLKCYIFLKKKKSNCKNSLRERLCMYYLSWPSPPQLLHSIQKLIHRQRHIFLFKRSWNNSCCFEQVKNHISIKETKRSEQTPSTNILFLCNSTLFTLQIVTFFT